MAASGVWGIDIGQCGLKALRCTLNDDDNGLVATAFDYIEYPQILSQVGADADDLVRQAFEQFLSRNKTKGDRIAMSVSGQFGLTRFFKPPPVEAKRLPDLVRYEARQTIPFPLDEVVWDWQKLAGGMEVEGFTMDLEVGLFAMKREQVFKALAPFNRAGIETDVIQLSPLAVYNLVTHEMLGDATGEFDPEDPPESLVVLSMGTDATDLVVTNGYRMWLRSIPLGGSHFTKQLMKELKLTFAKAEHLKRNARQAEDPKAVFQAMRQTFSDLVNEVQRSLVHFQNIDRKAKLGKIVLVGNASKLPGLGSYLTKQLGNDVVEMPTFQRLDVSAIDASPNFKDNVPSFAVSYGLCLQTLGLAKMGTNLLPREIVTTRLIREKKPWTLAAVAALLLAWSFNYSFHYTTWYTVNPERSVGGTTWEDAGKMAESVSTISSNHVKQDADKVSQLSVLKALGDEVAGNNDRRLMWLELVSILSAALPRTPNTQPGVPLDPKTLPFTKRQEIHVEYVESEYFTNLSEWFTKEINDKYVEGKTSLEDLDKGILPAAGGAAGAQGAGAQGAPAAGGAGAQGAAGAPAAAAPPAAGVPGAGLPGAGLPGAAPAADKGPEKEGWVIEMRGYHYYNGDPQTSGRTHLINTLMRYLHRGKIRLPGDTGDPADVKEYTMKEVGVLYPTLILDDRIDQFYKIPNPLFEGAMAGDGSGGGVPGGLGGGAPGALGGPGGLGAGAGGLGAGAGGFGAGKGADKGKGKGKDKDKDKEREPEFFEAPRYQFTLQFVWQPVPASKRLQLKREEEEKAKAAAQATDAAAAANPAAAGAGAAQPNAVPPNAGQPNAGQPNGAAPVNPMPPAGNPAANPAGANPAAGAAQPAAGGAQPAPADQPGGAAPPAAGAQPNGGAPPAAGAQPGVGAQPGAGAAAPMPPAAGNPAGANPAAPPADGPAAAKPGN